MRELLEQLIATNSANPKTCAGGPGEAALADFCAEWLRERGVAARLVHPIAGRPALRAVCGRETSGRRLLLFGHLDTHGWYVPLPSQDPRRCCGPGASDMKAGIAIALTAMHRLSSSLREGAVELLLVPDEENASEGARRLMSSVRADGAILLEATGLTLGVRHAGRVRISVAMAGIAEAKSAACVLLLRSRLPAGDLKGWRLAVSGGPAPKLVLQRALHLGEEGELLRDRMSAEVTRVLGAPFDSEVREPFGVDYDAPVLAALARQAALDGVPARFVALDSWTEAGLLTAAGIPCVIFGPAGGGQHTRDEWVDLPQTLQAGRIVENAALEFCAEPRGGSPQRQTRQIPGPADLGASDTFCVMPWTQLIVRADGGVDVCNRSARRIYAGCAAASVVRQQLDEIWNCGEMRYTRRAMRDGQSVEVCRECYALESSGGISLRLSVNRTWAAGFLNPDNQSQETLLQSMPEDARASGGPRLLQLDIGNLCNLRCRMCNAGASSRIARDPVHRAWTGPARELLLDKTAWFRRPDVIQEIVRSSSEVQQLHIIGGEPFVTPEVGGILQAYITAGLAQGIELSMHTNGTFASCSWLHLAAAFRRLVLYVSIDGFGPYYEYIRHPARWDRLIDNIGKMQLIPNAELRAHIVVQAYNVLRITDLFECLDSLALPFAVHLLRDPPYLRATILPETGRSVAAVRIRQYAERHEVRTDLLGIAAHLESEPEGITKALFEDFNTFTNDLDLSRSQNFSALHGELLALFRDAGFTWSKRLRHVSGVSPSSSQ